MQLDPEMMDIALRKELRSTFDQALERVSAALASEGFGILTRIDVRETLKKKLGVDFRRYEILGACNPPFAHRALQTTLDVGVLLPCNVVVYEADDRGTVVLAVDPMESIPESAPVALREVASEVRAKLRRVLDRLE